MTTNSANQSRVRRQRGKARAPVDPGGLPRRTVGMTNVRGSRHSPGATSAGARRPVAAATCRRHVPMDEHRVRLGQILWRSNLNEWDRKRIEDSCERALIGHPQLTHGLEHPTRSGRLLRRVQMLGHERRARAVSSISGSCLAERRSRVAKALPKRCQNPGRTGPRWANVGRAQSRRNARFPGIAADLLVRGRRGGLGRTVLARNTAKQGGRAGG